MSNSKMKPYHKNPRQISDKELAKLKKNIAELGDLSGIVQDISTGEIITGNQRCRAIDVNSCEIEIVEEYAKPDKQGTKAWGFVIWEGMRLNYRRVVWNDRQREKANITANSLGGIWDWDILAEHFNMEDLEEWSVPMEDYMFGGDYGGDAGVEEPEHNKLTDRFVVPPFSVLDTRQGYWADRKKAWHALIQDGGETREGALSESELMGSINDGVSILDPVLAELAFRWFGIEGGSVFDCFAGDTVFGYVSAHLGANFTGVELRQEQCDVNNERVSGMSARYICDDGQNVGKHIKAGTQDMLFSCPPYFDLEVYSDDELDASNQGTYGEFMEIINNAFTSAIKCLKDNRFAVIVVGDVRDKNSGAYYDFVGDMKRLFIGNGMVLYNELVLVEPVGTLPQRVGRYMRNRKVGKCHQNVLVFYKGDTSVIASEFPELDCNVENIGADES